METLHSTSGFNSEASLSGRPYTPPYTPARLAKRRLERSDSPASTIGSIHPADTGSPAAKVPKTCVNDDIKVEELTEGDLGYMTDIDVVYPEELEELDSSDEDTDADANAGKESDVSDSEATQLTRKLSRLRCGDDREVHFEQKRRLRHLSKWTDARRFKRTHSQSVKGELGDSDVPLDDHDHVTIKRRLRRRTRGPARLDLQYGDYILGSSELSAGSTGPGTPADVEVSKQASDDAMEVEQGT